MSVLLDHAASTPMRPVAIEAYLEALGEPGNPASVHAHGQAARRRLEDARDVVAAALGCDPIEVVFTSGGTEAINLAVKGMHWARNADDAARPRILVPRAEHHATLDTVSWLERHANARPEWLEVDDTGVLRGGTVAEALAVDEGASLVTCLLVNNEVGAVQPVRGIAREARSRGVPVHVDAVAALGHVPVSLRELGADALSVSAHKIGGPVGIGALAVSRGATLEALHHGGGQQRALRAGTQTVALAASFAAALRELEVDGEAEGSRLAALRDRLLEGIVASVPGATVRGPAAHARLDDDGVDMPARSPANAHVTFDGVIGETLLFLLDLEGVSVSTGSACQAGVTEPSHVVLAMGLGEEAARGAVRFSLGATTSDADIDRVLAVLPAAVERARAAS